MNEVLYQFELDKKYIEEYPLETTEGTKKMIKIYHINAINSRNAYVNNKIDEYTKLQNQIYEELNKRIESLIPKDTTPNYTNIKNQINTYKNIIKYNNPINEIYEKLDFDKIISDIGDIEVSNLSEVNLLIKKILNIFNNANINLTINDFNYSVYTTTYMQTYFNSQNIETFHDDMKNIFDQIYWECPNLITHIKLNLRYLYNKYKKQLELYFQNLNSSILSNNNTNINNYFNTYINLTNTLEQSEEKDTYLLSYKFLNNEMSIYDYLPDTPQVRKHFNRFLIDKEYTDLEGKELIDFFKEIKILKNVVVELNGYNFYKDIIKDVITRYKDRDKYKGLYQNKLKELEKEEKERINLINQFAKEPKRILFFTKKTENKDLLKIKINEQIKKIDNLCKELDDLKINETIINKLNETSTVNDALIICVSYYSYFKQLYLKLNPDTKNKEFNEVYNKLFDYVYNVDNTFIKKIKFIEETDITDIILDKYKLLNIKITKDDLTDNIKQLEDSIDFINLLNNVSNSTMSVDTIKFIIDFRKINKN